MRKFVITGWAGKPRTVEADYVQFSPGHTLFWEDRRSGADGGLPRIGMPSREPQVYDRLVLAIHNPNVIEITELEPEPEDVVDIRTPAEEERLIPVHGNVDGAVFLERERARREHPAGRGR